MDKLESILKELEVKSVALERATVRANLASQPSFQEYQNGELAGRIREFGDALAQEHPKEPLTPYEIGKLHGQRKALMSLTFTEATLHAVINDIRARIQELEAQKKEAEELRSRKSAPTRREGRPPQSGQQKPASEKREW